MSMSTGYVRTHIYIEDMRMKKALSIYIQDRKNNLKMNKEVGMLMQKKELIQVE